jgi:hypothetical protein
MENVPKLLTIDSQSSPSMTWNHDVHVEMVPVGTGDGGLSVVGGGGREVPFHTQ